MKKANPTNTCLQGYVTISYDQLVATFGQPHETCCDKGTVEWCFEKDDVLFTVYDYKIFCPKSGEPFHFHVGGCEMEEAEDMVLYLTALWETEEEAAQAGQLMYGDDSWAVQEFQDQWLVSAPGVADVPDWA